MQGIEHATRDSAKGPYHKTRHGFAILEILDPAKVRDGSVHARAFLDFLSAQLS
jgi:hypothetical protein